MQKGVNRLISVAVCATSLVLSYACTNDVNQCSPQPPNLNIVGQWNYTSTFVIGYDTTLPKPNFMGVISFDKDGRVDDPYHLLPTRLSGKPVEKKLYRFNKDTLRVAFLNSVDTLLSLEALTYTNECSKMTIGDWGMKMSKTHLPY